MRFFFLLIILATSSSDVSSNKLFELVTKEISCKVQNSGDIFNFFFKSDKEVILKKKIKNKKEVLNYNYNYNLKSSNLIIYNPFVLPIREETHIDLLTLRMRTGIFTNRYPMVNKGTCLYKNTQNKNE